MNAQWTTIGFWGMFKQRKILEVLVTLWRNLMSCTAVLSVGIATLDGAAGSLAFAAIVIQVIACIAAILAVVLARLSYKEAVTDSSVIVRIGDGWVMWVGLILVATVAVSIYILLNDFLRAQSIGIWGVSLAIFLIAFVVAWYFTNRTPSSACVDEKPQ